MVRPSSLRAARGAALIEAALVIPILLVLIGTTYELGSVFRQYLLMQQIAYEGARAGSQLTVGPGELEQSCYNRNTSAVLRSGTTLIPQGANRALLSLLQRVDALTQQHEQELSISCDDWGAVGIICSEHTMLAGLYRCCQPANREVPSFAAEFIPAGALTKAGGPSIVCEHRRNTGGANSRGDTVVEGTVGVRVSGRYEGQIFPFSLRLTAESRAQVLANQDFSTSVGNSIDKISGLSNSHLSERISPDDGSGLDPGIDPDELVLIR